MGLNERRVGTNSLTSLIISSIQTGTAHDTLLQLSPISQNPLFPLAEGRFAAESIGWQLKTIFNSYSPQLQEKFRDAVVLLVSNWSLESQGPDVLTNLCWTVSGTRALKAIKPLCGFVESDLIANKNQGKFQNALRAAMGVIGGSARFDETRDIAREAFERWFGDPAYERYSAMLLNGLCRCSPENYAKYFPRFLDIARMHPDYFDFDFIVTQMIKIVSPPIIYEHLDELPLEARELLKNKLQT